MTPEKRMHTCANGEESDVPTWWEYDGQGIELCRVCDKCREEKLSKYNPSILRHYTQEDVDEPIESDENYNAGWQDE